MIPFKGWPRLTWVTTDHMAKPPKDWVPPERPPDNSPAYIEYTTAKDGSVVGVVVSRAQVGVLAPSREPHATVV